MKYIIKSYPKRVPGTLWFCGLTNIGGTIWSSGYKDRREKPFEFDSFHEARKMLNKIVVDDAKNHINGLWFNNIEAMK